jgi:hypothetical protein
MMRIASVFFVCALLAAPSLGDNPWIGNNPVVSADVAAMPHEGGGSGCWVSPGPDWNTDVLAYTSGETVFSNLALAVDSSTGNIFMFFNVGDRDSMRLLRSTDGGANWTLEWEVNQSGWQIMPTVDLGVTRDSTGIYFIDACFSAHIPGGDSHAEIIWFRDYGSSIGIVGNWTSPLYTDSFDFRIAQDYGYHANGHVDLDIVVYRTPTDSLIEVWDENGQHNFLGGSAVLDTGAISDVDVAMTPDMPATGELSGHAAYVKNDLAYAVPFAGIFVGTPVLLDNDNRRDKNVSIATAAYVDSSVAIAVYADSGTGTGEFDIDWAWTTDAGLSWYPEAFIAFTGELDYPVVAFGADVAKFGCAYLRHDTGNEEIAFSTDSLDDVSSFDAAFANVADHTPSLVQPAIAYDPIRHGFIVAYVANGTDVYVDADWFGVDVPDGPVVALPERVRLIASPNPFNPTTAFSFDMPRAGHARLEVFDMLGRKVETVLDGIVPAVSHEVRWDAGGLPSGAYLARLATDETTATAKVMLLK